MLCMPDNEGKNTEKHWEYVTLFATSLINAVWSRKIFYGKTLKLQKKTEKTHNDLT
jgi:hypothetical protein